MKTLVIKTCLALMFVHILAGCTKALEQIVQRNEPKPGEYFEYRIKSGSHTSNYNTYVATQYEQLKFVVRFDSSAIYQTIDPLNQWDINKLFGFSDNNAHHHEFSARFGWNWSDNALRLFTYVYSNSQVFVQEICTIQIGEEYSCSIRIEGNHYIFSVNNTSIVVDRSVNTDKAVGYKLYPYFGGDETAPHDIKIMIKEL